MSEMSVERGAIIQKAMAPRVPCQTASYLAEPERNIPDAAEPNRNIPNLAKSDRVYRLKTGGMLSVSLKKPEFRHG